jgi:hypothetical protein
MNAKPTIRLAAAIIVATGLTGGLVPVTVAATATPTSVVQGAKKKHKLPDRCWPSFKTDVFQLRRRMEYQMPNYVAYYQSENAILDQMVELLTDPNAQDLIPRLEEGEATYRATMQPIIAEDRDATTKMLANVEKANKSCFKAKRKDRFVANMTLVRSAFRDLFKAYGKVLEANLALQSAQTAKAQGYLNDAALEAATVEGTFDQGIKGLVNLW